MRAGMVFAHDHKAFQRWLVATRQPSAAVSGPGGRGLTGADLEHVLSALLITNPDIVAVVPRGPDGYPQRRRPN